MMRLLLIACLLSGCSGQTVRYILIDGNLSPTIVLIALVLFTVYAINLSHG